MGEVITGRSRIYGTSGLLLVATLLFALNLRAPFVSLAPIVDSVAADLGVTPASMGLLTGIPVLCFALLAPVASVLLSRVGVEKAVMLSLLAIFVGTCIRSAGTFELAVVGTTIIGAAITIGNVSVPVLIARDFPQSAAAVTGMYTAALNVGSVVTTLVTAPLAEHFGWQVALLSWSVVVVAAAVVWRRATAGRLSAPVTLVRPPDDTDPHPVWRRPITWCLTFAFAGQAFSYYAVTTWLPKILSDLEGMGSTGAGGAASLFQLFGALGGVAVPVLLARGLPVRWAFVGTTLLWLTLPLGLLVAPQWWPVWIACAGSSQGGNFTLVFTLVVQRTRSQGEARRMSAMVQTLGYAAAAIGPFVIGALHTSTGSWTAPLAVVIGALTFMGLSGFAAANTRPPGRTLR